MPSCYQPWRSPGTGSSSRCRRRLVSARGTSQGGLANDRAKTSRTMLHWRHPPLKSTQEFSLPLDCGILRIDGIAFVLDDAKLALDQL